MPPSDLQSSSPGDSPPPTQAPPQARQQDLPQADPPPSFESETGAPVTGAEREPHRHITTGLSYALAAYFWWGLIAIYFKIIAHVPPLTILAHRIVWCSVMLFPLLLLRKQWGEVIGLAQSKSARRSLTIATLLIATNWGIFIYAISVNRLSEASLGYYINPLLNVLLGRLVLGERLTPPQWSAVALAFAGVTYLTIDSGTLPWISLVLAGTFATYGLVRKQSPAGPMVGLFFETTLMMPLAGGFLLWVLFTGDQGPLKAGLDQPFIAGTPDWLTAILLPLGGLVTAMPLLWFAAGARRLRLSTIGFIQYIAPTLQFLVAVLLFGEAFDTTRAITFSLIWLAVVIFMADSIARLARQKRPARPDAPPHR